MIDLFKPVTISNIILAVTLVAVFIGIFFFTYAATIERQIVSDQMKYIASDFTHILRTTLNETQKNVIKSIISNLAVPNMDKEDEEVKKSNNDLIKKAAVVLGVILFIGILSSFLIAKYFDLDYTEIFVKNLIILFFIGLVEFIFITYFATNFISADPNLVKRTIIKSIKEIK